MTTTTKQLPSIDLPPAAPRATLKCVYISGTPLMWVLGQNAQYTTKDGVKKLSTVSGIAVVKPPVAPGETPSFSVQVHIRFEDNYTDIIVCEDHLVVKAIEVGDLAIPQKTLLIPVK